MTSFDCSVKNATRKILIVFEKKKKKKNIVNGLFLSQMTTIDRQMT